MKRNLPAYEFLYTHHGLSWLTAEIWRSGRTTARSEDSSIQSIARIDAAVAQYESRESDPRVGLIAIRNVLELKSEILLFWGGIVTNSTSLIGAGMAVFAVILGGELSPLIALLAFALASIGLLVKVEIERRRTWVHLQLLSVKRRLRRFVSRDRHQQTYAAGVSITNRV